MPDPLPGTHPDPDPSHPPWPTPPKPQPCAETVKPKPPRGDDGPKPEDL